MCTTTRSAPKGPGGSGDRIPLEAQRAPETLWVGSCSNAKRRDNYETNINQKESKKYGIINMIFGILWTSGHGLTPKCGYFKGGIDDWPGRTVGRKSHMLRDNYVLPHVFLSTLNICNTLFCHLQVQWCDAEYVPLHQFMAIFNRLVWQSQQETLVFEGVYIIH